MSEWKAEFKADLKNIGLNIKAFRTAKNLTQEDLGDLVNLTKVSISRLENGSQKPDLQRLSLMASVLDKELKDFFQPAAQGGRSRIKSGADHNEKAELVQNFTPD
jgi:transcriptional regulator with XRE-family HTH domain